MDDVQVPVIAVFTKYDQFKRNIKMKLEDEGRDLGTHFDIEVESVFNHHYFANLGGTPPFVRLESEDFFNQFTPIINFCLQECTSLMKSVLILLK
jgi:hypothetical protein